MDRGAHPSHCPPFRAKLTIHPFDWFEVMDANDALTF
jgi:hypothetical protein